MLIAIVVTPPKAFEDGKTRRNGFKCTFPGRSRSGEAVV